MQLLKSLKITFDVMFVYIVVPWYPLLVKTEERFWKALPILWYSFGKAVGWKRNYTWTQTDTLCEWIFSQVDKILDIMKHSLSNSNYGTKWRRGLCLVKYLFRFSASVYVRPVHLFQCSWPTVRISFTPSSMALVNLLNCSHFCSLSMQQESEHTVSPRINVFAFNVAV